VSKFRHDQLKGQLESVTDPLPSGPIVQEREKSIGLDCSVESKVPHFEELELIVAMVQSGKPEVSLVPAAAELQFYVPVSPVAEPSFWG